MSQGQEVPAPRLFHVVSTSLQRSLHSIFCMYGDIEALILCRTAAGNTFVWKISETESNSACREHLVLTHLVYEQLDAIEKPEKTISSSSYLPFFHESWSQSQQLLTIFALNFGKAKWVQPAKKGSLQVAKIIRKQVQVADPRSLCWNLVLSRLPGVFQLDDFFHENMSVNFHGSLELGISEKGTSKFLLEFIWRTRSIHVIIYYLWQQKIIGCIGRSCSRSWTSKSLSWSSNLMQQKSRRRWSVDFGLWHFHLSGSKSKRRFGSDSTPKITWKQLDYHGLSLGEMWSFDRNICCL